MKSSFGYFLSPQLYALCQVTNSMVNQCRHAVTTGTAPPSGAIQLVWTPTVKESVLSPWYGG